MDAVHALQRLTCGMAQLLGSRCALVAQLPEAAPLQHWLGGAQADLSALQASGRAIPLDNAGQRVGSLWLESDHPAWADQAALDELLHPLLQTSAALLAAHLEGRGLVPPASLSLARAAMHEAGCFVWDWDIPSDVLSDIDEGAAMLGYLPNEVGNTQADWNALIHPDDLEPVEQAYLRHVRGESALYRVVYRARASDGSWRWLEERGRVIERDAAGQPIRMCGTQTDATLHHALEQAQRERLAAEAANAAKTQFLSRVSHELRTPLNAVLGFAQLLEMDQVHPLTRQQLRQVGLIREAGAHLLAMIGDLLDVSLMESGRLPVQAQPLPLAPLLAHCVALVQPQADAAGVMLTLGGCAARIAVQADATRLKQVLINLLNNAVKYNRPQGQVQVSVRECRDGGTADEQMVAIEVHDTGLGLTAEQLERLFEPFNRLGRERGKVPGAGIGLALSQMLVEAMQGTLGATSDASGTRFLVRLPQAHRGGA